MKTLFTLLLGILSFSSQLHAQSLKEKLAELKLVAKQKINDRVDQKSNNAMDTVLDKSERTVGEKVKGKKKKKKEKIENTGEVPEEVMATEPKDGSDNVNIPVITDSTETK